MKKLIIIFSLMFTGVSYGQITTFKAEIKQTSPSGPYDSLTNFLGVNVQLYVGQDLYVNGVHEQLRKYGYRGFIKNYKRDYELNDGNIYKLDRDEHNSSYDALVGKYFTVLDVIKKPDEENDINNGKVFFLKLKEKQGGDIMYFVYDTAYDFNFPFIVVGYMTKLKQHYVGKKYTIGDENWKCIDVAIEETYYKITVVLQNEKGEKKPFSFNELEAYEDESQQSLQNKGITPVTLSHDDSVVFKDGNIEDSIQNGLDQSVKILFKIGYKTLRQIKGDADYTKPHSYNGTPYTMTLLEYIHEKIHMAAFKTKLQCKNETSFTILNNVSGLIFYTEHGLTITFPFQAQNGYGNMIYDTSYTDVRGTDFIEDGH